MKLSCFVQCLNGVYDHYCNSDVSKLLLCIDYVQRRYCLIDKAGVCFTAVCLYTWRGGVAARINAFVDHCFGVVVKDIGAEGLRFYSRACQSGHCRQWLATAATFLCCPGAKSRRWAPPLVTRFGVMPRV